MERKPEPLPALVPDSDSEEDFIIDTDNDTEEIPALIECDTDEEDELFGVSSTPPPPLLDSSSSSSGSDWDLHTEEGPHKLRSVQNAEEDTFLQVLRSMYRRRVGLTLVSERETEEHYQLISVRPSLRSGWLSEYQCVSVINRIVFLALLQLLL